MVFDLKSRVFYWINNQCILNMLKPGPQWIWNFTVVCTGKACVWYDVLFESVMWSGNFVGIWES